MLSGIWSELLGLARVDLDDNLFHLGGRSLIAVQLVALVQRRLHIKLAVGHFLGMERTLRESKVVTVEIGDDVWIGPGSLILPNVTIGKGSVVAASSVVSRSVPPSTMVQGNPAIPVAMCPLPLSVGVSFEESHKNLLPLDWPDFFHTAADFSSFQTISSAFKSPAIDLAGFFLLGGES